MSKFISDIRTGKEPLYFESAIMPQPQGSVLELSGTNYHDFVTKSNMGKSKLVLITHKDPSKNYGIKD